MDRIGKKQDGDSVKSSIETKENTYSTTTNASKKIAKTSTDIPSQRLDERITTVPNSNQSSDESESINQAACVAFTDESSGADSSTPNMSSQWRSLPPRKNYYSQFFNENNSSTGTVSKTKALNSEQRNFLREIRSAIKRNNWREFRDIIIDVINMPNSDVATESIAQIQLLYTYRVQLNSSTVVNNLLFIFIRENHIDLIRIFLELGANANLNAMGIYCLLAQASAHNNVEAVNLLLKHGAHVDGDPNLDEAPPLLRAIASGAYDCVELLLSNKAQVNYLEKRRRQYRPLCTAAYLGHTQILELLLQHGAGAIKSESSSWRDHPLNCAAYSGSLACVTLLLSNNYSVDGGDQCRLTPLSCAVQNDHIACAKLLLSREASFSNELGWNSLWSALRYEYVDRSSNLNVLSARSYIDDRPSDRDDKKINIDMVRCLLDHGADPNARYGRHSSILLMPIFKNDTVCVNLLLQHGSFSNLSYDDILSPISSLLEVALIKENINMVRILILAGAVLNSREADMYVKLLRGDKEPIYSPPLCLQSLCLQTLYPFVNNKGSPKKNAEAVTSLNLPHSFNGTFHSVDKSIFFKYSS
jgi:ankyrin repeat protein